MATLLKKLTLRLGDEQFECQLNRAEVTDEPSTEEIETFCGTETFATASYKLNLEGFQDWTDVNGLCEIIADSYESDPVSEIEFEVALGEPAAAWRSGTCKPTSAPSFGGTAGSPLAFSQVLDIVGQPDKVALT
jgi:hypothetical protein